MDLGRDNLRTLLARQDSTWYWVHLPFRIIYVTPKKGEARGGDLDLPHFFGSSQ